MSSFYAFSNFLNKMNDGRRISVPIDRTIEKIPAVNNI